MAHIAILVLWEAGHLLPTFQIGRELALRGHRVTYATTADLLHLPRSRGFETLTILEEAFPPHCAGMARVPDKAYAQASRREDVERAIQELGADIVLVDSLFRMTYAVSLRRRGLPVVLVTTSMPNDRGGGVPPITGHLLPGGSLRNRLAIEYSWLWTAAGMWNNYLRRDRPMSAPTLSPNLPELVLCPEDFDFPHRPPRPGRHYVGPSLEIARPAREFPWHELKDEASLVYCSFGTQAHRYGGIAELTDSVIHAVADRPNEQLVITTDRKLATRLDPFPANVIAVHDAPQIEILRRASVAITHGGLGTVKECILLGVPMIVIPQAFDQPGNAARVEFHGLGLRTRTPPGPLELRRMLDHITVSRAIATNVQRMSTRFQAAQSVAPAAAVIEMYLHRLTRGKSIVSRDSQLACVSDFPDSHH